ncbi:hypothetical protein MUP07_08110 [Candidatus Bathyarchaeota archaeon]|nr:hypothetical protein [Candidatus Bathyarchaeota archaeon]
MSIHRRGNCTTTCDGTMIPSAVTVFTFSMPAKTDAVKLVSMDVLP